MPDRFSAKTRSRIMSSIRGRDTKPEVAVRRLLHSMGLRFRNNVATLPGKPDIVLPRWRVAVLIMGCFWHSCPKHGRIPGSNVAFWEAKFRRNRGRDRSNIRDLGKLGWRVAVVWECELRNMPRLKDRLSRLFHLEET